MKFSSLLLTTLLTLGCGQGAQAADKWHVGLNELSITGHMIALGHYSAGTHSNADIAALSDINARLLDLIGNQHVGMFREIVNADALEPTQTTNNFNDVIDVVGIYAGYNANLVLALGPEVPNWMLPTSMTANGNPYVNIMPDSDTEWEPIKNNLAWEMGNLVNAIWNSGIPKTWISTHLYIEGFNEFDSLRNSPDSANPASNSNMTPARAADLQNGVQYVLNYYGISVQTLMPSIATGNFASFIQAYYQAGGTGNPNVHIYNNGNNGTVDSNGVALNAVGCFIQNANNATNNQYYQCSGGGFDGALDALYTAIPASMQNSLFIGEVGAADENATNCPYGNQPAMDPTQRQTLYSSLAADSDVLNKVYSLIFWRSLTLASTPTSQNLGCEYTYGVATPPQPVSAQATGILPTYNAVGTNLFNYLKN